MSKPISDSRIEAARAHVKAAGLLKCAPNRRVERIAMMRNSEERWDDKASGAKRIVVIEESPPGVIDWDEVLKNTEVFRIVWCGSEASLDAPLPWART